MGGYPIVAGVGSLLRLSGDLCDQFGAFTTAQGGNDGIATVPNSVGVRGSGNANSGYLARGASVSGLDAAMNHTSVFRT